MTERTEQEIVDDFHRLYYKSDARTWGNTKWMGVPVCKCPFDLWIYQEIIHEVVPDVILEMGTYGGGSALYWASLCDLVGHGRVVTVDVAPPAIVPSHPRITYLTGSSISPEIVAAMTAQASRSNRVLVNLDSAHDRDHVLRELELYAPLVTPGSYVIVEDSNVNGHPALPEHGPGPAEAIDAFLATPFGGAAFEIDRAREKFFVTFNPSGYLKRRAR